MPIGQTVAETWPFFNFFNFPSWILKVEIFNTWTCSESRYASTCKILCQSVELLQRFGRFSIFQDGGRPPSWIGFTRVGTTHEEYLVVFVTVQNLVDPIIYSEFHRNPFRGFGAPGVKIWPFPLHWLVAFTTACTTVQAVIRSTRDHTVNDLSLKLRERTLRPTSHY